MSLRASLAALGVQASAKKCLPKATQPASSEGLRNPLRELGAAGPPVN
jgi:hypothetical protein